MSEPKNDLLDILFLARVLASADGDFASTEKEFFKKLIDAFGLTADDMKSYDHTIPIKEVITRFESLEAKKLLVDVLMVLASSDGDFDDKEQKFIKKAMNMIDLKPSDYPVFKFGEEEVHKIFSHIDDFMAEIKENALALNSSNSSSSQD